MSNQLNKTQDQAGPSNGIDRKTIILAADSPEPASTEETQALPGCEGQEAQVRELHTEWIGLRRKSLRVAFQLGRILMHLHAALKEASPKRRWEPYVRDHLGIEPRTASNYMRIHREASCFASAGELLRPETISEMGIREALDILADLKTANGSNKNQQAADLDLKAKNESGSQKAAGQPPLQLVDGSQINLERLHWIDGLVPRSAIESWMSETAADSADPERGKIEARRQRVVIQIAAGINRACGKAEPSAAMELVDSSLDAIRMILRKSRIA
jgi:hypothetical protein